MLETWYRYIFFFFLSFYKETKTRVNSYEHKSLKGQRREQRGLPHGRRDGVLEGGDGVCPKAAGGGPESRPEFTKIKMLQKIKIIIIIIIVVVVNRVCQLPPCTVVCILAPRQSILLLPPRLLAPPRTEAPRHGPGVGPGSGTQAAADAAPGARALHART